MNRGGLAGASWELDDRFTAYDAEHLVAANLDAGKMLLRIDATDAGTVPTLQSCARAVGALNDRRMLAMVEPIPYTKDAAGRAVWDHDPLQLVRAVGVCAALGGSSAYTWLKIQATADIATVAAMTTQPLLLLGGAPGPDPAATFAAGNGRWPSRRCAGSSSAGPCCIRPTATSRRPSARAAELVDGGAGAAGRPDGGPATPPLAPPGRLVGTPDERRLDLLRAAGRPLRPPARRSHGASRRRGSEVAVLPLPGRSTVDVEGRRFDLAGRDVVFAASPTGPTSRSTPRSRLVPPRRRRSRCRRRRGEAPLRPGLRARRRRAGRDPRRRPGDPPGHQLHVARVVRRRRQADVRRAAHAGRQLVELPAAPPRRQPRVPGEQRGDLLLPGRSRPAPPTTPPTGSGCTAPTPRRRGRRRASTVDDGDVFLIPAATTGPASPRPATRCTTSTCSPALAASGRWRSATIPPTTGCATTWVAMPIDPRCPMTTAGGSARDGGGDWASASSGSGGWARPTAGRYRRIPTLFPDRAAEPDLVVCADAVAARARRRSRASASRRRRTTGARSSSTPTSTSSS